PGDAPAGINLSGGLDSRSVLGLLTVGRTSNSLHTFTFGIPGCDDARIARELAAKAGTHHHFLQLKPDYLLEVAEEGVRLTDGMESCVHMHALAHVNTQAKHVDIIYTGYLVDSLISPTLQREWLAKYDDDVAYKLLYDDINILFLNKNKDALFTEDFQKHIDADPYESFRSVASEARAESIADWQNQFEILNRQRRFTGNGSELLRGQVVCRTPFTDKDLIEFTMSIPPGLRLDRFLYKKALARCCHDLSKIPWEKTGLPLVPCIREVRLRIDQQARWQLQRLGLRKWISDRKRRPYADYDTWMRTSLRGWVEKTLLGARSRERGYFNPDYISNLVAEHIAGADHSRELGVLITLELWHRQLLD
ncbi:MAG: asparagine synthase-related protein, partial [Anaerolineales bacterium]